MISTILLVVALILFAVSAAGVPSRINLQSAGLACWVLSLLIGHFPLNRAPVFPPSPRDRRERCPRRIALRWGL